MMLERLQRQLTQKLELLPYSIRNTVDRNTKYHVVGSEVPRLGHRRNVSLSSFNPRKTAWIVCAALFLFVVFLAATASYIGTAVGWRADPTPDDGRPIPLGKSIYRNDGREIFWWEQFPMLVGYFQGRREIVQESDYVPEQEQVERPFSPSASLPIGLTHSADSVSIEVASCSFTPPVIPAYDGLPQGMPSPLLGSMDELGINSRLCYDRIHRYGPYGLDIPEAKGGFPFKLNGENERDNHLNRLDYSGVKWHDVQEDCLLKNQAIFKYRSRTAFVIRTWHTFKYTPYHVIMLRAIVNELSLRSGGQTYVHFLIHVQDDSIPIWASEEVYNQTLQASLPPEFQGMGTLWSVAQMKLIYPPPFPQSLDNFSGGDVYQAYRSLHFPLQYFASRHSEFDHFWQWEMDIRVTGHYGELLDKISIWAEKQSRDHLWERSSKFFIPALHNNSYADYSRAVAAEIVTAGLKPIAGPLFHEKQMLPIPVQDLAVDEHFTDLITLSPLFDPSLTRWAFRDDITGYSNTSRPPTRAALVTASRLSRRLLVLMHEETFRNNHTMFPEMYPASIALQYGLKAVYAPIATYLDRDWPAEHANEVFNNARLRPESITAGMDNGGNYFHTVGGSVFGPGEHVFRGASWYSNALFAGYLWRRWLGNENRNGEVDWEFGEGNGRMCLPMMILHPIKNDL